MNGPRRDVFRAFRRGSVFGPAEGGSKQIPSAEAFQRGQRAELFLKPGIGGGVFRQFVRPAQQLEHLLKGGLDLAGVPVTGDNTEVGLPALPTVVDLTGQFPGAVQIAFFGQNLCVFQLQRHAAGQPLKIPAVSQRQRQRDGHDKDAHPDASHSPASFGVKWITPPESAVSRKTSRGSEYPFSRS